MLQDAKDSISDQEALQEKIKKIKSEQICGVEILDTIFMLCCDEYGVGWGRIFKLTAFRQSKESY